MNIDIYDYAKKFNEDYYDSKHKVWYKVKEYNHKIKFGLPARGIMVTTQFGRPLGYAKQKNTK